MSQPSCTARTKRGATCRSWALPGRDVCISHAEDLRAKVEAARRQGGTAAAKLRILTGRRQRLETPRALARFLSDLAQDALAGTVPVETARCVAYICAVQRQVVELSQDSRSRELIAEVEALLERSRRQGWAS